MESDCGLSRKIRTSALEPQRYAFRVAIGAARLSPIHDRMPVILPRELESLWLDHDIQDPAALDGILRPYPAEAMEVHEVSSMVNSTANDGPEVVVPLGQVRPGDGPALRLL